MGGTFNDSLSLEDNKSAAYLTQVQNLPGNKVLSPNHCLFPENSIPRLDKLMNPYLGEKPTVPHLDHPIRQANFMLRNTFDRMETDIQTVPTSQRFVKAINRQNYKFLSNMESGMTSSVKANQSDKI